MIHKGRMTEYDSQFMVIEPQTGVEFCRTCNFCLIPNLLQPYGNLCAILLYFTFRTYRITSNVEFYIAHIRPMKALAGNVVKLEELVSWRNG